MTSSGQKGSVKEHEIVLFGWFDKGVGWSLVCFVCCGSPPCSLSYLLLMGGKWKEYFFKTSVILLCIKVFKCF